MNESKKNEGAASTIWGGFVALFLIVLTGVLLVWVVLSLWYPSDDVDETPAPNIVQESRFTPSPVSDRSTELHKELIQRLREQGIPVDSRVSLQMQPTTVVLHGVAASAAEYEWILKQVREALDESEIEGAKELRIEDTLVIKDLSPESKAR